jgi:hypothetical protein
MNIKILVLEYFYQLLAIPIIRIFRYLETLCVVLNITHEWFNPLLVKA